MEATPVSSFNSKLVIDSEQYDYFKGKLWEFAENEDFTDFQLLTRKDEKYCKKVHRLILNCFCKLPITGEDTNLKNNLNKAFILHHETELIENLIELLYNGKCLVLVKSLTSFMELVNFLKVSDVLVYDERGNYYFLYLMKHKHKLINYLCYLKKNAIDCDIDIVSLDSHYSSIHSCILAVQSKKFCYYYKNRISTQHSVLIYVPLKSAQLEIVLNFLYSGQAVFNNYESDEIMEVVYLLGIERFRYKTNVKKTYINFKENPDFIVMKPPENTSTQVRNSIVGVVSPRYYIYLWIENKCFIFPLVCFKLLGFLQNCTNVNQNPECDVIVIFKYIYCTLIKRFVYSLYTWSYTKDEKYISDLLGLVWPVPMKGNAESENIDKVICDPGDCVSLHCRKIEDLQNTCCTLFDDVCDDDEIIIKVYTCEICGEQLLTVRSYLIHAQEHSDECYLCQDCGILVKKQRFKMHSQNHDLMARNDCVTCIEKFPSTYWFNRHMNNNCPYTDCTVCFKRIRKEGLGDHLLSHRVHFQCEKCDKLFKYRQSYLKHQTEHLYREPLKCTSCTRTFTRKNHLRDHMFTEHPMVCKVCRAVFKRCELFIKHMSKEHHDVGLTCRYCDKKFSRLVSLRKHERFHTYKKPYDCGRCPKSFMRSDMRNLHVRVVHEKVKYNCPICNKKYSTKNYFIEHGLHVHEKSLNPEGNEVCISKEATKCNSVNKTTLFDCPICSSKFNKFEELVSHLESHV